MKTILKKCLWLALAAMPAFAAETLFSNYTLNVNPTGKVGSLWVFSRGDIYSGVTFLNLSEGVLGVKVSDPKQEQVSDSMTAVQYGIFSDVLAEHRRTPSIYAGKLGYVLPMFGLNDDGYPLQPEGFFSVRGIDNLIETPLSRATSWIVTLALNSVPRRPDSTGFALLSHDNLVMASPSQAPPRNCQIRGVACSPRPGEKASPGSVGL